MGETLNRMKVEIDEIFKQMQNNVSILAQRGEKLESMASKANELKDQTSQYNMQSFRVTRDRLFVQFARSLLHDRKFRKRTCTAVLIVVIFTLLIALHWSYFA